MDELLAKLNEVWYKQDGASVTEIDTLEESLKVCFPEDYRQFLQWSDGGEGEVGSSYLSLWPVAVLPDFNIDYQIQRYVPGLLAIGTDGGPECYALDYRVDANSPAFVRVPLGDLDPETIVNIADSFSDGIRKLLEG